MLRRIAMLEIEKAKLVDGGQHIYDTHLGQCLMRNESNAARFANVWVRTMFFRFTVTAQSIHGHAYFVARPASRGGWHDQRRLVGQ